MDWLCHDVYGADVVVELHRTDEEPVVVSSFPTYEGAMDSAIGYLADRGFGYWINEDLHRREQHSHMTLHPVPVD